MRHLLIDGSANTIQQQLENGNISMHDADALLTFQEFLERAGPVPVDGSQSPGLKRMLKTKKWRRYMGLEEPK